MTSWARWERSLEDCVQLGTRLGHLGKPPSTGKGLFLPDFPDRRAGVVDNVCQEKASA